VYMTYKDLREKFGNAARQIRDKKYELQGLKSKDDKSPPWWQKHPELPNDKDIYIATKKHVYVYVYIHTCMHDTYIHTYIFDTKEIGTTIM